MWSVSLGITVAIISTFLSGSLTTKATPLANEEQTHAKFDDVKGNVEAKKELERLVDYLKNPSKYEELAVSFPKGILMIGPPGCGTFFYSYLFCSK
jgi:ATP-dependent Zn protease